MATWAGWLFHYSDGTPEAVDTDPNFQGTITFRPNEAAEQFVPDALPEDDSQLFAPAPVEAAKEKGGNTASIACRRCCGTSTPTCGGCGWSSPSP